MTENPRSGKLAESYAATLGTVAGPVLCNFVAYPNCFEHDYSRKGRYDGRHGICNRNVPEKH